MVSIHNQYEHLEIINYLRFDLNLSNNAWIGLNNQSSSDYTNPDGTDFDYQTNTSSYPWTTNLNTYNQNCVIMEYENDFRWNNRDCTNSTYKANFICNYCYDDNNNNAQTLDTYLDAIPKHAYYVTDSRLSYAYAIQFCYTFCQSEPVSIHSELDHNFAKYMAINHRKIGLTDVTWQSDDVWLGLIDAYSSHSPFWLDNTPFNYGNIFGEPPWQSDQPSEIVGNIAFQMDAAQDYLWKDVFPGMESFGMCNACDTKINKYIPVYYAIQRTFDDAESYCQDVIGTHLASLHSVEDMSQMLFAIANLGMFVHLSHSRFSVYAIFKS